MAIKHQVHVPSSAHGIIERPWTHLHEQRRGQESENDNALPLVHCHRYLSPKSLS